MISIIRRLFSVNYMLKPHQYIEQLPTTKDVYKTTFNTAWPSALEAFLVGVISLVDTIMVAGLGGELGTRAVAAVGITNQPRFILLAFIFSLNAGVTSIVARRKGEGNRERANATLRQCLVICGILIVITGCLGYIFAREFLTFAGAKKDTIDMAVSYFRITTIGSIFSAFGMTINAAQRGSGNTKISMRTNIIANVVNMIFNYFLIYGNFGFPRLEVAGAAIATAMGSVVMCVICFITVIRPGGFLQLTFKKTKWRPDKEIMSSVYMVSSSSLLEQLFMRAGFFITAKLIADLGTAPLATHQICMNILNISFTFGDGLGIASSALVGRSLGAEKPDMAIIFGKVSQRMALMVSSLLFVIFIIGRSFFVGMFTDDLSIIKEGARILIVLACVSPFQTSQVVISGSLRGAGDTRFVAATSFLTIGLLRPFATWLFCYPLGMGVIGAWFSLLLDQIFRLIMNFIRFSRGKWTSIKV